MTGDAIAPPPRRDFVSIQYLRGIAASMVVVYHIFGFERLGLPAWQMGGGGVDIFFVISGFIMWTTAQQLRPAAFMKRRLIRLVPLYWLATAAMVALSAALPLGKSLADRGINAVTVALSLLFVPFHFRLDPALPVLPVLPQGWTLSYEMLFYLSFAAALCLPTRRARATLLGAEFLLLGAIGAMAAPAAPLLHVLTNPIALEFLLGIFVASLAARAPGGIAAAAASLAIGCVLLSVSGGGWFEHPARPLVVGVPAALVVLGCVGLEAWFRRYPLKLLHRIGDASYALYLTHSFALAGCGIVFRHLPLPAILLRAPAVPVFWLFLLVSLAACIVVALAIHYALERPLTRWLNRRLRDGPSAQPAGITAPPRSAETAPPASP